MSQYLITISIGPVQGFIAAARKTRDLWMGSYLLSEISKAVAKTLYDKRGNSGELIFPNPEKPKDQLAPCDKVEACFNVGNKLLALVETENPSSIIDLAEQAAQKKWEEIAEKAKNEIPVFENLWQQQFDNKDVLEFFAAWVAFEPKHQKADYYKSRRERLDRLLNARKNTRDFIQNPITANGIPKSSLDGLRENVINHDEIKNKWALRKAGLNEGEFLDITGIAKRLGEKPDQFTPLSRLAIDPWLRGMPDDVDLEVINSSLEQLLDFGLCTKVAGNQGIYDKLPYDGQLLFLSRIEAEKNKISLSNNEKKNNDNKVIQLLDDLSKEVKALYKQYGNPQPYMAMLAADGDRMGELLDNMQTLENHQLISSTLTRFATEVPNIVRKYYGHCVYAGGDDVLALLPLDQAIACSRALADKFQEIMEQIEEINQRDDIEVPTLSVGLGISHVMTPMPKQLDLARKAEKLAKSNELPEAKRKNALAVIVNPRSGAEISFRERWDKDADIVLCKWIEAHLEGQIPRQAGYNLREEAINLNWCNDGSENAKKLINAETQRILGRKRKKNDDGTDSQVDSDWINRVCERAKNVGLDKTADELIMTYRIAQAYQLAGVDATACTEANNKDSQEKSHV